MSKVDMLKRAIAEIGSKLTSCRRHCAGITRSTKDIALPRYLVLESEGRSEQHGSVIVGINPGAAKEPEIEYFRKHGIDYKTMVEYWHGRIRGFKYYTWLKKIPDNLGLKGPILWTELVKCSSKTKRVLPPLETFRICIRNFLSNELELVPRNWPLIASGSYVYRALSFRFPKRIVIGVPHPTGSYGYFQKMFSRRNSSKMLKLFRPDLSKMSNGESGKALWLNAKRGRIE